MNDPPFPTPTYSSTKAKLGSKFLNLCPSTNLELYYRINGIRETNLLAVFAYELHTNVMLTLGSRE